MDETEFGISKDSLRRADELERELGELVSGLRCLVESRVRQSDMPGVTWLSRGPDCFLVPFSQLVGWNLTPEYYSSEAQVDVVGRALAEIRSCGVGAIRRKLDTMVLERRVTVGRVSYPLNLVTLDAIGEVLSLFGE